MNMQIIYHGLAMAGKTTNLEKLREIYSAHATYRLHQQTSEGRTVYLDILSMNIKTRANHTEINLNLMTTPGQGRFKLLRAWIFGHVDGLVMVVDSSRSIEDNLIAFKEIADFGLLGLPSVFQADKRVVPRPFPIEVIGEVLHAKAAPGKLQS